MDKVFDIIYWSELSDVLKQNFPMLTAADLQWRQGTLDDMLETTADKLGITKNELQKIIDKL